MLDHGKTIRRERKVPSSCKKLIINIEDRLLFFLRLIGRCIGRESALQLDAAINEKQLVCDRLVGMNREIVYCSYLDTSGARLAETTDVTISDLDQVIVSVLPLHPNKEMLVLAISPGCKLAGALEKVRRQLLLLSHEVRPAVPAPKKKSPPRNRAVISQR